MSTMALHVPQSTKPMTRHWIVARVDQTAAHAVYDEDPALLGAYEAYMTASGEWTFLPQDNARTRKVLCRKLVFP